MESVAALTEEVRGLVEELNPLHIANHIQLALDRLAQALQVAMATGALLCSRGEWDGLCLVKFGLKPFCKCSCCFVSSRGPEDAVLQTAS